jgi:hypothetical protein
MMQKSVLLNVLDSLAFYEHCLASSYQVLPDMKLPVLQILISSFTMFQVTERFKFCLSYNL